MQTTTIGNTDLLKINKTAFFAPSQIATLSVLKCYDWAQQMCDENKCVISGFSSRLEKDVLHFLLKGKQPIIVVLSRKMYHELPEELKEPTTQGRLLIISTSNDVRQSKQNAYRRNCYIAEVTNEFVFPTIPNKDSSLYSIYTKLVNDNNKKVRLLENVTNSKNS
jgi:hypothetical protein